MCACPAEDISASAGYERVTFDKLTVGVGNWRQYTAVTKGILSEVDVQFVCPRMHTANYPPTPHTGTQCLSFQCRLRPARRILGAGPGVTDSYWMLWRNKEEPLSVKVTLTP